MYVCNVRIKTTISCIFYTRINIYFNKHVSQQTARKTSTTKIFLLYSYSLQKFLRICFEFFLNFFVVEIFIFNVKL